MVSALACGNKWIQVGTYRFYAVVNLLVRLYTCDIVIIIYFLYNYKHPLKCLLIEENWKLVIWWCFSCQFCYCLYRGPAPFHRLTPNKRLEPVFSTVIMAVCSLFNRMLSLTDLIPVHLLYCGQTVMIGRNHTSFEWTRVVRHIYGIIRHMQGLYWF